MNRKIFTILLLAVFMLTQFSMASAAPAPVQVAGDVTIEPLPTFVSGGASGVALNYKVTNMTTGTKKFILAWFRYTMDPIAKWGGCQEAQMVGSNITSISGSFAYPTGSVNGPIEFYITVDDDTCGSGNEVAPTTATPAMVSSYGDKEKPTGFLANPPDTDIFPSKFRQSLSCNTFEMWALMTDAYNTPTGYSGITSWEPQTTGTFSSNASIPNPEGKKDDLYSWIKTIPATATGSWQFAITVSDAAKNAITVPFRENLNPDVTSAEKEDCKNFTDVAGHEDEVYIRYLADLDLIAGNPDGSFNPDSTLTRAETAALLEKANGYTADTVTKTPSATCTFSDVNATDWFAGWVWQACADGIMNGTGNGLFDPSNTLTRGQIVTIFNNIYEKKNGSAGSFLDPTIPTIVSLQWGNPTPYRSAAWTDVFVGDYYAIPVQRAYSSGVDDGTSATTFSPNQPATRGEFAKMLYRALSRYISL